ncbi:hypothetical protein QEN19_002331 [Hanseniaspora menglaensis]
MSTATQEPESETTQTSANDKLFISEKEGTKQYLENLHKNYTWKKTFQTWRNSKPLAQLEFDALNSVTNIFTKKDPNIEVKILDTEIDFQTEKQASLNDKKKATNYIHELSISNKHNLDAASRKEIVMVHGYGASLGLFFNNFESFAEMPNTNFHALDLLGFGLSSRPQFPKRKQTEKVIFKNKMIKKIKDKNGDTVEQVIQGEFNIKTSLDDVQAAENFFVDSLESWRKAKEIEHFTLIGHSLGGYLSSCYALKYPERVDKLILVSPVGVETSGFDLTSYDKSNHETVLNNNILNEALDVQQEFEPLHENMKKSKNGGFVMSDAQGHVTTLPHLPSFFSFIWKNEISPFTFVRKSALLGPAIMSNWSFSRFIDLRDETKIMKMHEYCYGNFSGKGSGEYCLPRVLGPGVLAYHPLLKRVPQGIKCDSLWMYGDSDWMNSSAGAAMCQKINKGGKYKAEFEIVSKAGHHLYLDNASEFNKIVSNFINED